MILFRGVLKRVKSCFSEPTLANSHTNVCFGQESLCPVEDDTISRPCTSLIIGSSAEAVVQHRTIRPPDRNLLLEKAEHNPGFWYPCVVLALSSTKAKVRFDGSSDAKLDVWLPKALVRRRCRPDSISSHNTRPPAGTLVEVQVPDRWGSDGIADRWSWWPGVVQVYSHHPAAEGKVTVALDLSRDCRQKQLEFPRGRIRTVLPAGTRVRVEGAGVEAVNGIYEAVGFHDGVPMFECGRMAIVRCAMPSGSRFWYLADKNHITVDDADYYRIYSGDELPPMSSCESGARTAHWGLATDGVAPVPTIQWITPAGSHTFPSEKRAGGQLAPVCPSCCNSFASGDDSNSHNSGHTDFCLERLKAKGSQHREARPELLPETAMGDGSSSSDPSSSDKYGACVVCLDGRADCAAIPCGHMCLCEECAYELKGFGGSCPICRSSILFAQRIFA